MHNKKHDTDYFDDDFEVIYTGELPEISLDFEEEYEDTEDDYEDTGDIYSDEYPEADITPRRNPARSGHRPSPDLAAPLRAPVRAGSRMAGGAVSLILRLAPILMSAGILILTIFAFWTEHSAYGEPSSIAAEQNFTLAAYLIIGGILLLWEISSFFFVLSGVWSKAGRGITFFILVYACSYIASLTGSLIPEGLAVLDGIRGGIVTYGSLYPRLFTLCILGIAACVLQKVRS